MSVVTQTIEDLLRTCAINFKGNWDGHLPLIEFSYNNSYHVSIDMPPYEALYGRKYRSSTYWDEVGEFKLIGLELVQQTKEKVKMIRKKLIAAQDRQKKYMDQDRKDIQFEPRDKVLLKISSWKDLSRFGKKGKLSPRTYDRIGTNGNTTRFVLCGTTSSNLRPKRDNAQK
ncbi:hypothetical protein AgCh_013808 [Apium graveolens]